MKYAVGFMICVLFIGCSSTQIVSYRPSGSTETPWQITVHKSAGGNTFQLFVDDSLVIEKAVSPKTNSLAVRTEYRSHEVILVATYTSGFLGLGTGHEVHVFVNNDLAAKLKI